MTNQTARIAELEERVATLNRDYNQVSERLMALRIDLDMARRQRNEAQSEAHRVVDRLNNSEQNGRDLAARVIDLSHTVSALNDTVTYAASLLPAHLGERLHGYAVAKGVNQ